MSTSVEDTATVDAAKRAEVDAVVSDEGLVVPLSELESLDLVPGQQVHVTVSVTAIRRRKNMRGILAGKVRPITREEIKEASRDAWGEYAQ